VILLNIILFTLSGGILFYVVKYRVHVHVSYQKSRREPKTPHRDGPYCPIDPRRDRMTEYETGRRRVYRKNVQPPADPNTAALLRDTLVSLGASKQQANKAASRAISLNPSTPFEGLLRAAIQETTAA